MSEGSQSAERQLRVGRVVEGTRPAVASSSIVLVRDRAPGGALEVLMLERHIETDFAGGALVFPGGKVDEQDRELPAERVSGADAANLADELGAATPEEGLGLAVAAVREAFEEAGVLLARDPAGRRVDAGTLSSEPFVAARAALASRETTYDWRPFLAEHGLVLDLAELAFFMWWATPDGLHRRYDTRFFVARVPDVQVDALAHDDVETTSLSWLTPAEALAAGRTGRFTVIYPTRKLLEALAGFASSDELLAAARDGRTDRRRLKPVIVTVDGRKMVQHPDGGTPEPG